MVKPILLFILMFILNPNAVIKIFPSWWLLFKSISSVQKQKLCRCFNTFGGNCVLFNFVKIIFLSIFFNVKKIFKNE